MPTTYRYPDPDEATTAHLVAENELVPESWFRSEELVLAIALGRIAERFRGAASCLDAGAGSGRLIRRFGAVSRRVTALELDPSRIDRDAIDRAAAAGDYEVSVEEGDAAEMDTLSGGPFDVVVLSHVLQHAPRARAAAMAAAAARILRPEGLLFLSVPVSEDDEDEYVLALDVAVLATRA